MAAAAAACLALGILAGPLLNQPAKPDASYSVAASSGLQVTVGLVKKTWGTELAVDGRSLPVAGTLSLWVKDRDGGEDRACAWTATPTGRVRITGATPVQLARIASVEMRDRAAADRCCHRRAAGLAHSWARLRPVRARTARAYIFASLARTAM